MGKQIFWEETPETPPSFSVILYGGNPQRWTAFDQGVRQACNDVGYAKPMIYVPEKKADYEGQMYLIEREIANGAQGVIVACENSEQLQPYLEKIMNKTAVVPVLNGVSGLPCIQPNYEALGREVGQGIVAQEGEKVLVIENYMDRDSVKQMFTALMATLNQRGIDTATHSLTGKEGMETSALVSLLEKNTCDVLVVLDNETMEAALVAKESIPRDIKL
ncbi:MAG: substrate-binding domain-containing protein [Clostridiales bacterium]|nr:substrate-binding domain-containing protein [Clostridiales bacterium]